MNLQSIPKHNGRSILSAQKQPAFRISAEEVTESIRQQFDRRELALRELGQNSQDAEATVVTVDFRYEDGRMIMEFSDNGCGMSRDIFLENYLCLFNSSKEGQEGKVGKWALGRLSLLCYDPERIEVFSLAPGNPGLQLVIEKDLSGTLYEMETKEMEEIIKNGHGTMVHMTVGTGSEEEFVKAVNDANDCMARELAWISPSLTTTSAVLKDGSIEYSTRKLNTAMQVPGLYSSKKTIRLASGKGEIRCALGLSSQGTKGLAPITLCSGSIPIERPAGLAWTGNDNFALQGMHIILDSFDFMTNIGRNVVDRETTMMVEFLPKFFEKIVLESFVAPMAKLFKKPSFRFFEYEDSLRLLMADVCIKSGLHNFTIPGEVLEAPFLPSYITISPYSLSQLDKLDTPLFYTQARPNLLSIRDTGECENGLGPVCLCLADLPWDFRKFLSDRYGSRLQEKKVNILVQDVDSSAFSEINLLLRERLGSLFPVRWNLSNPSRPTRPSRLKLPQGSDIRVARFMSFDGREDTMTPSVYFESEKKLYLNCNQAHIDNLLTCIREDGPYAELAVHFLVREIFFTPELDLPLVEREQLLTADLLSRFGSVESVVEEEDLKNGSHSGIRELAALLFGEGVMEL